MVTEVREQTEPVVRGSWSLGRIAGWVGAVAFAVSGVWFGAIAWHVSVAEPPAPAAGLVAYYTWLATTLQQERLDTALAIVGFASVIVLARLIAAHDGNDRSRAGTALLTLGSALWIVGNILQLGGHRAVGLMATHANPIQTTNSLAFTIDTIDDAFEMAAFAVLAVGALILAGRVASTAWRRATVGLGLILAVVAVAYITGPDGFVDGGLVLGGVIAMPVWLVWTGRTLDGPAGTVRV
jgi:hypothetical protein